VKHRCDIDRPLPIRSRYWLVERTIEAYDNGWRLKSASLFHFKEGYSKMKIQPMEGRMTNQLFLDKARPSKRRLFGLFTSAILLTTIVVTPSLAHKTFLWPSKFLWNTGDVVDVALTSALAFPDLQFGPTRDRISFTSVVLDNEGVGGLSYEESDTFLNVTFTADRPGLAVIAMSSKPRFGEIKPEDASGYFDEIGAEASVRAAFEALPGSPPLNRSYSKHSKTFICVETCTAGHEARFAPVDQALEFVAVKSDETAFMLLRNGKAVADHVVSVYAPDQEHRELSTNADGVVTIDPSMTGAVMMMSIWITVPEQADGVYHSDYATLTIDVSQKG
jgi:Domain of unknown function (DUF4198)